ncbi:hypothetical protein EX30DRAFT_344109, partial [Ascodesmis nigricans]
MDLEKERNRHPGKGGNRCMVLVLYPLLGCLVAVWGNPVARIVVTGTVDLLDET